MEDPKPPCQIRSTESGSRTKNGCRFLRASLLVSAALMVSLFSLSSRSYGNFLATMMPVEVSYPAWVEHLCPRYYRRASQSTAGLLRLTWKPLEDDAIFFMETSCAKSLGSRQACVVESAAYHQPHQPIRLLMTAPYINHSHPLLQVVLGLDNVHASWLDLDQVYQEEPLLTWHRERQWMLNEARSPTFVSDSSRIELLKRFGGTFLDLDMITLRSLPSFSNWVGWHALVQINNAAMNFVKGHPSLQMVASSIPKVFDPKSCCRIGPYLLYDVMHELCPDVTNRPNITETDAKCGNVTIFARIRLYPFSPYTELDYIFQKKKGKALNFFTSQNDPYFLHLYSSHTTKIRVPLGNLTLLGEAAMRNCPKVYNAIVKHGLEL